MFRGWGTKKSGRLTVVLVHPGEEIGRGLLTEIIKETGLSKEEFLAILLCCVDILFSFLTWGCLEVLLFLLFFDFLDCLFKRWDVMFDCLPDGFGIHAEVCMDEFVSHACDFFPGQVGEFWFEGVRKFFGCFANDSMLRTAALSVFLSLTNSSYVMLATNSSMSVIASRMSCK